MKTALATACICIAIAFIISCSKKTSTPTNDPPAPPPPPPPAQNDCNNTAKSFAADANPIFQSYCNQSSCHNAGSINGPGPLTNYTQISAAKTDIRAAVSSGLMPQNATLSAAQKKTIICWIDSGAPNN